VRSDLLLKLTKKYAQEDKEHFQKVEMTGPHDYVLMEFYKEAQQENPDMARITPELVQLNETIFRIAVKKLQDKGYIEGAEIEVSETGMPVRVDVAKVKVTPAGVEYEKHLG
jgi:hypothetical protein